MFTDGQNRYCKSDHPIKSVLQIQCNINLSTYTFFTETEKTYPKIHMEL